LKRSYKKGTGIGIIAFVVLILFGIVAFRKIDLEKQSVQAKRLMHRLRKKRSEPKKSRIWKLMFIPNDILKIWQGKSLD